MRFAYADPPYLGCAEKYYGDPTYDRIEAHADLIGRLSRDFDGWALSLNEPTLRQILPLCPNDARVMAWVKPFASFKPNVNPAYAWEPVIVWGGRPFTREQDTVRDWVACNITLRRGFVGAKPEAFCWWLFDVLNMRADDDFEDVFPGSGAVTKAWESWCQMKRNSVENLPLFTEAA